MAARQMMCEHFTVGRVGDRLQLLLEGRFGQDFAENGRVGALGDAIHAAGAFFGDVFGDFGGDVTEIAQRRRPGGDK